MFYKLRRLLEATFPDTRTSSGATRAFLNLRRKAKAAPDLNQVFNLTGRKMRAKEVIPTSSERNKIRGLPGYGKGKGARASARSWERHKKWMRDNPKERKKYFDRWEKNIGGSNKDKE